MGESAFCILAKIHEFLAEHFTLTIKPNIKIKKQKAEREGAFSSRMGLLKNFLILKP